MCQLVVLEPQEVGVLLIVLDALPELVECLPGRMIAVVCLLVLCQFLLVGGEDVDNTQLEVLLVEQQVLVLGVHVNEFLSQLFEHAELYGGVVDECAALARGEQFAAHDAVVGVVLDVIVVEEGVHAVACQVEVGFDHALVGSLHDGLRVGPLTQQQGDGSEDDAFSGARLSGDD